MYVYQANFVDQLLFAMLLYIQSFKTIEFWEIAFSMGSTFVDIGKQHGKK